MGLREYKRKRDFSKTPEPADGGKMGRGIFVVQLHHASHRHFDFRLELDGVLKSWAVPKGPSLDPTVKRLAMEVEDHPVSYARFEGDIPKGHYGAGHVDIFDSGTWQAEGSARAGLANGELKFTLSGDILRGSWVLVRTRKQGSKPQWLLMKHRDEFATDQDADAFIDPATDRPLSLAQRRKTWVAAKGGAATRSTSKPRAQASASKEPVGSAETLSEGFFAPELCTSRDEPPAGDAWLHEVKWDGYRILASVIRGKVQLWSRNAIEWTAKVPELAAAIRSLKLRSAQLDGEMIVMRDGRDSFNALQGRLSAVDSDPPTYMLFDLLHVNGRSLRSLPLIARKERLAALLDAHPHPLLRYSQHQVGNGKAAFAQATNGGLEGVVSKAVHSAYSGTRSGAWIKSKRRLSDEFIVIGFTEPKGGRAGIGALLLALPGAHGLRYVGRVGTGLDAALLGSLRKQLAPTVIKTAPADISLMARKDVGLAIWVKPKLVVEAWFQGIGGQGLLRQPAFKAIRIDKSVNDIAQAEESPMTTAATKRPGRLNAPGKARKSSEPKAAAARKRKADPAAAVDEVVLTHPERVVFPGLGITKQQVAEYYRSVAPLILAGLAGRPLSVVRCPDGADKACFFQKHVGRGWGKHVHAVKVPEKQGKDEHLCIEDVAGLLELVQMNVLEFHPWGARSSAPDSADRIVFDLDPHADVKWARVVAAARLLRKHLDSIGLQSFVRTSGGKGLHVVVPLNPPVPWDACKQFARAIAEAMAALKPNEFVSVAGEKNREGKIFIDWLRNGRGATSVASYSLRARPSAGVSMPLAWEELGKVKRGDAITIVNAERWISKRAGDPWRGIDDVEQSLPEV